MPEDVDQLLATLQARMTESEWREWLRASHEVLDQRDATEATNAHLDRVAADHSRPLATPDYRPSGAGL